MTEAETRVCSLATFAVQSFRHQPANQIRCITRHEVETHSLEQSATDLFEINSDPVYQQQHLEQYEEVFRHICDISRQRFKQNDIVEFPSSWKAIAETPSQFAAANIQLLPQPSVEVHDVHGLSARSRLLLEKNKIVAVRIRCCFRCGFIFFPWVSSAAASACKWLRQILAELQPRFSYAKLSDGATTTVAAGSETLSAASSRPWPAAFGTRPPYGPPLSSPDPTARPRARSPNSSSSGGRCTVAARSTSCAREWSSRGETGRRSAPKVRQSQDLLPKIVAGVTFKDGTEVIDVPGDRAA